MEAVKITEVGWNDAARADLGRAMGGDPLATVDTLRADVAEGRAGLFRVEGPDGAGHVCACVEVSRTGARELVLIAGGGRGLQTYKLALDAMLSVAKARQCQTIRIHAIRPAVERIAVRRGFTRADVVMRRAVDGR